MKLAMRFVLRSRWITLVCPLFSLILFAFEPADGMAQSQTRQQDPLGNKNVLILNAFESNIPAFQKTELGLSAALQSGGIGIRHQFYEHLDLRHNPGPEHRKLIVALIHQHYDRRKIDFIITIYPEALEFLLEEGSGIFPETPVLALYLPESFKPPETDRRIIPHMILPDLGRTIEIALKLVPGAGRVYVVGGVHPIDRWFEERARRDFRKWEGRLEFRYLNGRPLAEILAMVSAAPPDSIVYVNTFGTDVGGKALTAVEAGRLVARVTTAPVFGSLGTLLGTGIVGGSLISFENIGNKAGEVAVDILNGTRLEADIPTVMKVAQSNIFDWHQLRRWDLDESALPRGSIIVNKEFSFWDLKYYIIGVLVFILLQTLLIIGLLVQNRRRISAEESLRQNEKDLRKLAARLISAQEQERSRLARELHDDLAQRLAVFAIDVGRLQQQLVSPAPAVQQELDEMKQGVIEISQDVHNLSRQLHPSILDDLGLIKAIESECTHFSRREGIEIAFNHENIPMDIPKNISLSLYRIIQEALSNISKHACAEHIAISLYGLDHVVSLSVQDDGIGFDPAEVRNKPGLGLSSMRERVSLMQGKFSVDTQPQAGTTITVKVPLTRIKQ